jgi:DNA-binding transcriptional LysR family regulator
LPDLDIRTIDFSQTNLIVSKSWWRQPDKLQALMRQLQDEGRLQEVRWFQEGVALARMNLGVAIVSEVYSKEDHLAAFALTPHEEFKRWIGIYYRSDKSLSSEACRVASLIEDYVDQNEAAIRNGRPPPLDDPFRKKWQVFNKTREWDKEATSRYPARPAQVTKPIRKRGR